MILSAFVGSPNTDSRQHHHGNYDDNKQDPLNS